MIHASHRRMVGALGGVCASALLASALLASVLNCGRLGFEPIASSDDAASLDATVPADATVVTPDAASLVDATPTTASLRFVGVASCLGPESRILVPEGGIAQGATLVVQVVRRTDSGTVAVNDASGNIYSEVEVASNSGIKTFMLQSTLTTALPGGALIDISESNPAASAIIVSELVGANPGAFSSQTAGADDANIAVDFTATSPGAVLCAGGSRDGDVVFDAPWRQLALVKDNCGGNGELTAFSYWISAGQNGLTSCEATLQSNGGFLKWTALVRSYGE